MTDFTEQAPVEGIQWNADGLVPCVMQDARTGEVLTLAWMNAEALEKTMRTGQVTFWSRSRKELWTKGETSGNTMRLAELKLDCDGDSLVARVIPAGPACHTGEKDCFFQTVYKDKKALSEIESGETNRAPGWGAQFGELLEQVRTLVSERRATLPEGSYTTYLFTEGLDKILKKLGEEVTETIIAAKNDDKEALVGEICDVLYHLLVMTVQKHVSLEDLRRELHRRHAKKSGTAEILANQGTGPEATLKVSRPAGCEELEERLLKHLDLATRRDVTRCLEVMYRAHAGQMREGGEPYATHPLHVALIAVEECKLRAREAVLAALLHDVLEDDMATSPGDLSQLFGEELAGAVVILTKMYKRDGTPKELGLRRYYEGLRSGPAWVKAIKICDRVHNLRSLSASGRSAEVIQKYYADTRENLLPLCATSTNQQLLKAGDLLLTALKG